MQPEAPQTVAPKANDADPPASQPRGIGGWLILPALALIITPIRMGFEFVRDFLPVLDSDAWALLATPASSLYHPLWAPLVVFELTANVVMFSFTLWLLVLFFRESKRVPMLYILWLSLLAAVQVIDQLLVQQMPFLASQLNEDASVDIARALVGAAIWIPYFLKSVRVKNTFVN